MVMVRTDSWLRDTGKLALLYFASGLAFAPWGIVYAVLRLQAGWTHPLVTAIFLACGLITALFVWQHIEKRLVAGPTPMNDPVVSRMTTSYAPDPKATFVTTLPVDIVFDADAIIIQLAPTPHEPVGAEVQVFSERFEPVARSAPRHTQVLELIEA